MFNNIIKGQRTSLNSASGGCHVGGMRSRSGGNGFPFVFVAMAVVFGSLFSNQESFLAAVLFTCLSFLVHGVLWVLCLPIDMMRWLKKSLLEWMFFLCFFVVTWVVVSPVSAVVITFWVRYAFCKAKAILYASYWERVKAVVSLFLAFRAGPYFPIICVVMKVLELNNRLQWFWFALPFRFIRFVVVSDYKSAQWIDRATCWSTNAVVNCICWSAKAVVRGVKFWVEEMGRVCINVDDPFLALESTISSPPKPVVSAPSKRAVVVASKQSKAKKSRQRKQPSAKRQTTKPVGRRQRRRQPADGNTRSTV